jgi:bifunctional DNase/RNase
MIEMKVAGIALDALSRSPIVLLKDTTDRRALPIWIGQAEARAIISALEGEDLPRPLTHDLMLNSWKLWNVTLKRVVIHSLQDNVFHAVLYLSRGDEVQQLDARPSDAIALALKANVPIWVMEEVVANASIPVDREADEAELAAFREFVAQVRPEDFVRQRGYSEGQESSDRG